MGRAPRVYVKGSLYYIISAVSGGQTLFKDDADRDTYFSLLEKYKEEYGFFIYGYVLEPKMSCLLIEPKASYNISQIMHALNSNYTKYYNGRYQLKGHLFRGRFKSKVIEKASYLTEAVRFLHYKPILDNLATKIEDYQCSSYNMIFASPTDTESSKANFLSEEKRQILEEFDKKGIKSQGIINFLNDYSQVREFSKMLRTHHIIGREEFIKTARLKASETIQESEEAGIQVASEQGAQVASEPGKIGMDWMVKVGAVGAVLLLVVNAYLFMMNLGLKKEATNYIVNKEAEFVSKLSEEKDQIKKGLDEKYRADMVSYKAMSRRLEIEKEKIRELEDKLGEI